MSVGAAAITGGASRLEDGTMIIRIPKAPNQCCYVDSWCFRASLSRSVAGKIKDGEKFTREVALRILTEIAKESQAKACYANPATHKKVIFATVMGGYIFQKWISSYAPYYSHSSDWRAVIFRVTMSVALSQIITIPTLLVLSEYKFGDWSKLSKAYKEESRLALQLKQVIEQAPRNQRTRVELEV